MKSISPKNLLIIIAMLLAVLVSASIIIYTGWKTDHIQWLWAVGAFVFSFITSILMLLFVNTLVLKKINQLLATVKYFRSQSAQPSTNIEYSGVEIDNLNLEILAWADDRKNEIERLKKLEIYRKEYLGNVSHELKTPIFNIQGYVLTLLDGGLEDPTINRNYLMHAEKNVDRMITIIDDL